MSDIKNILITGGCGFIGHHLVEYLLSYTRHNIYIIDKLSYASFGLDRLREIDVLQNPRVHIFIYDLTCKIDDGLYQELENINWILHLAAETHVDKSVAEPYNVVMNNIQSTMNLLEFARKLKNLERFLYFSTDEVYGPALNGKMFSENDRHNPTNPYSASKSASESLCKSYKNTYGIPLYICNAPNVYGERQHYEKFIPKCIHKIIHDETITIHIYPKKDDDEVKCGSRFYTYAKNVASAVYFILVNGTIGEIYNIPGDEEIDNNVLCDKIANILQKENMKEYLEHDKKRPNHDLRYGLDGSKLLNLGWTKEYNKEFDSLLKIVVEHTVTHPKWM